MKKHCVIVVVALLADLVLAPVSVFAGGVSEAPMSVEKTAVKSEIKNVIMLIPDGMSMDGVTLARWFQGGMPLALDPLASGLVRTYNADTLIADSAPAATAFATGYKTNSPYIGVLPSKAGLWGVPEVTVPFRPVASVLEAARLSGRSVGLVATCELPHATPADFSAHAPNRKNYDDILEQQVYNSLSVVFSGGYKFLDSANRKDKEDLAAELVKQGYRLIKTKQEFDALKETGVEKVWGLFAPVDLAYDIDRDPAAEPSLAEMTSKAIALLSQNPHGFFLMVEGSKIDWAAHANEPVALVHDILAFDKAVEAAVKFASSRNDTVVIISSDHGNSGITMGNQSTSSGYDKVPLDTFIKPLQAARKSGSVFASLLDESKSNVQNVLASVYGIQDASAEEIEQIKTAKIDEWTGMTLVGQLIAKRAKIGFTTGGHTGEDVVLYQYAPLGAKKLSGTVQNNDIAWYMAELMGLDLKGTTQRLFADAKELFAGVSAVLETNMTDPANPVLVVKANGKELLLPVNKNYGMLNGTPVQLDGVTVYINETKSWYVSSRALDVIK
ncbi:alkaline phosphatase [Gracilinema caldarium]|uniref:alkaline phosphatase n=1 Tax=Gracilinema caldarium TaxID=215591 RepID=UPI0026ECA2D4|nr:alkaline phosphatase [Gracilinema caldarium]